MNDYIPGRCGRWSLFGLLATMSLTFLAVGVQAAPPPESSKTNLQATLEQVKQLPHLKSLPADFQPYIETIPESGLQFLMVPIPGGTFRMGAPDDEANRLEIEGPAIEVEVGPFWMGAHEITWSEFDYFAFKSDIKRAEEAKLQNQSVQRTPLDLKADAVTRPTPPYVDMTFGYGHDGYPAICMTQHSATKFCEWLSTKTGRTYRLPTEAEFERAARAGTQTPYFFGSDLADLDKYSWFFDNSNEAPKPVGLKAPNPWGLYDILGNVAEWCQDKFAEDYFERLADSKSVKAPLLKTDETEFFTARGGSWIDDGTFLRCATRMGEDDSWKIQDPQIPQSIWWLTDAHWVGFRLVRPYQPGGTANNADQTETPAEPSAQNTDNSTSGPASKSTSDSTPPLPQSE